MAQCHLCRPTYAPAAHQVREDCGLSDTDETFALGMRLLLDGLAPLVASADGRGDSRQESR